MTTQPTRSPSATSPAWQRSWSYSSRGASSSSTSRRRGDLLKELPVNLHYAVGLVNIDLAIAILVGLVDHVLALLTIDSLYISLRFLAHLCLLLSPAAVAAACSS